MLENKIIWGTRNAENRVHLPLDTFLVNEFPELYLTPFHRGNGVGLRSEFPYDDAPAAQLLLFLDLLYFLAPNHVFDPGRLPLDVFH